MKLTTHLQLVPRSRKYGSIHPLPHMPSWRSAELVKHRDNFTLPLSLYVPKPIASYGEMMNDESETVWKEEASWPNRGTIPEISWRDLRIPRKISVRVSGVPAEARTERLPITILEPITPACSVKRGKTKGNID
jgi:hypothetical protein